MNKLETSFGSSERKKNGVRGLILAALMSVTPALASEPAKGRVADIAMVSNRKDITPEQAMENAFALGLREISQAKDMAQQRNIWLRLATTLPVLTLRYSEFVDPPFLMEMLRVACSTLADKQPAVLLERAIDCTDLPLSEYQTLIMSAAKKAVVLNPEEVVNFRDRFESLPGGSEIMSEAMKNLKKKTPQPALKPLAKNR